MVPMKVVCLQVLKALSSGALTGCLRGEQVAPGPLSSSIVLLAVLDLWRNHLISQNNSDLSSFPSGTLCVRCVNICSCSLATHRPPRSISRCPARKFHNYFEGRCFRKHRAAGGRNAAEIWENTNFYFTFFSLDGWVSGPDLGRKQPRCVYSVKSGGL